MWRLVCIQGIYNGRFFDLAKNNITIGKGNQCIICLPDDENIADKQSELLLHNESYVFKDLHSGCSTMVNGAVPTGEITLSDGDKLQIGESVFRLEQDQAHLHPPVCAFPQVKAIQSDSNRANLVSAKLAAVILLIIILIAVPNIRRANENRAKHVEAMRIAQEAVDSFISIGSALKVGVSHDGYSSKVIDAQNKIDIYISKFGKDELAAKLLAIQQSYIDAGELWNFKIRHDNGEYFSQDPCHQYGDDESDKEGDKLFRMCRSRYPEMDNKLEDGGAAIYEVDSTRLEYHTYHTDTAMQIIWEHASEEISKLKLPESSN